MTQISPCAPADLGPVEIARWRELQGADRRLFNPFLAPEFALVLGRHRADVRVAVISDGPQIVGFLPYHHGPFGIGRALGYGVCDGQAMVHSDGMSWNPKEFLAKCGLVVWEFDELLAYQAPAFKPRRTAVEPAPYIDLTPGWESWLASKRAAGGTIKTVQRKQRKLGREVGEVAFEFDSKRPEDLKLLMRWKSQQYRRTGRFDRFKWPWFVGAFEELTQLSTPEFSGVLSVLSVDGRPIAIEQALSANGVLDHWFPAYDASFSPYSPGLACTLEFIRSAAERGMTEINLGKGEARYKDILKDGDRDVAEGSSELRSPIAVASRLRHAPRVANDFVVARPRLRLLARHTLSRLGRIRTALRRD